MNYTSHDSVTNHSAQVRGAKQVVGVDIDESLIRLAWKHRRTVWSHQRPSDDLNEPTLQEDGDRRSQAHETSLISPVQWHDAHYFPASLEHALGPLPIPPKGSSAFEDDDDTPIMSDSIEGCFPHNVTLRTADWVAAGIDTDADGYDLVLGFSVTKWIHLNGGDEAIRQFFSRAYSVLRPGGVFVVEPQAWETYTKARRIDPALKETMKHLELRPDNFGVLLSKTGFSDVEELGVVGEGGFARPLISAHKA